MDDASPGRYARGAAEEASFPESAAAMFAQLDAADADGCVKKLVCLANAENVTGAHPWIRRKDSFLA